MRRLPTFCRRLVLCVGLLFVALGAEPARAAQQPPALPVAEVVKTHAAQLAAVESDQAAVSAFTGSVGPAMGLRDAVGTLAAKGIPAKMAKELGLADLSLSVQRLMAALSAWQAADAALQALDQDAAAEASSTPTAARQQWLASHGPWQSLDDLLRLSLNGQTTRREEVALAANRLALEASQRAAGLWWDIQGWKDRVRTARGRTRLCGTWQWVIHNHQNHQEQKTSLMFLPQGMEKAGVPTPAEIVVLGDAVYLRWEIDGRVQEDSLLFIKDGSRLEGSFVNNTGGWGSITGKRTAGCQ